MLYGRSVADVAAAGSTAFTVPSGATEYRVVPESGATLPFTITAQDTPDGGATETWESFLLDPTAPTDSAGGAVGGWTPAPPAVDGEILVANSDAINLRSVVVLWRMDLLGVL